MRLWRLGGSLGCALPGWERGIGQLLGDLGDWMARPVSTSHYCIIRRYGNQGKYQTRRRERRKQEDNDTVPEDGLSFGKQFTDHMMMMRYSNNTWSSPQVTAMGDIPMHPASQVLHYGMACFEGIKAFRNLKDPSCVHLFRPDMHMRRLEMSASRVQLPRICPDEIVQSIQKLVRIDQAWVPHRRGQSLYVRPLLFSSSAMLGVTSPSEATMTVVLSPCRTLIDQQHPLVVYLDEEHCRAWPGGTGHVKLSSNYPSTIYPQVKAKYRFGADQVLYMSPSTDGVLRIDECGTMNVFFVLQHEDGPHVITPALNGTILPGVTRASIVDIIRGWSMLVEEKTVTLEEVQQAARDGSLLEIFACGTAAGVQSIARLVRKNGEQVTPMYSCGPVTRQVRAMLLDIQHGMHDAYASWLHSV